MTQRDRGDFHPIPSLHFLAAISIIIGSVSAFVAYCLLNLIRFFTNLFFFGQSSLLDRSPSLNHLGVWVVFIPVAGSLLIGLMARYGSEKIRGHGIPEALEAILFGKSLMEPKVAILKPLSSAISIGSGGPFGAEGPIIMTGGAFASLFAQLFHLTSAERKTLLVAGAAAGMSAVFATPISAVLLSVELLLFEWKPRSVIPVAIASLTAAGIRPYLLGQGPLFPIQTHFQIAPVPLLFAVVVGIVAGAFSSVTSNALYKLEDQFAKLPVHWMWWPAIGGLIVGIGGYHCPRVLGVGYDVIGDLLQNRITTSTVLNLVGVKALVWLVALASGTSGGVLAPLLIMGAGLGSLEAVLLPIGSNSLWTLVSMAAVLGGMMRSPFTACLFALELTHDVSALPALFAGSVTAYAFTVLFMKRSILTEKVARRGYDIFREYSVDPLERLQVEQVMSPNVVAVSADLTVGALIQLFFRNSSHSGFPVNDKIGNLVGIITKSDLLRPNSSAHPSKLLVERQVLDFASKDIEFVHPKDSCRIAADRMAECRIGRLLVVLPDRPNKVVGIITRSDLLKARTNIIKEENLRERHIHVLGPP